MIHKKCMPWHECVVVWLIFVVYWYELANSHICHRPLINAVTMRRRTASDEWEKIALRFIWYLFLVIISIWYGAHTNPKKPLHEMLKLFDFMSTLNFHKIATISRRVPWIDSVFFFSFLISPPIILIMHPLSRTQSKMHKTTWTWCRSKCKSAMLPVKPNQI